MTAIMETHKPATNNPFRSDFDDPSPKDEWEDWEDDESPRAAVAGSNNGILVDPSDEGTNAPGNPSNTHPSTSAAIQPISKFNTQSRHSVQKPIRIKSKGRQKAQNAKAGIKVVTDMSKFRAQNAASQARPAGQSNLSNQKKFVDPAALLALEGEPNSSSIGSFSWLKRKPGNRKDPKPNKTANRPLTSDLSPVARPIVIGISVPSDNLSEHQVSPHTAVLETPIDMLPFSRKATGAPGKGAGLTPQQQRSVWSPDTEASESPYSVSRHTSSIYSQQSKYGEAPISAGQVPPVPALPATLKFKQSMGVADQDDDDAGTPCTMFEEDGSPVATRKSQKPKGAVQTPDSASSQANGWWDHVTTPFAQQNNPFRQQAQETGSSSSTTPQAAPQEWWSGADEKKGLKPAPSKAALTIVPPTKLESQRAGQSTAGTSASTASSSRPETQSEKAHILLEENTSPGDEPPPYSPPKAKEIKYGAISPPAPVSSQRVPSPGPMTPGLPGTMTSQGAIVLEDIPLTPSDLREAPAAVLPDRLAGSYVTGDHFLRAPGRANKSERQRRRHEKEDAVARKAGGFWRGRCFVSENGCFGRTGREGRKRRRVCLGIAGGIIGAIILIIVLVVVLTKRHHSEEVKETPQLPSVFLNLTDFPPMPTGILTVVGPDNPTARSDCLTNAPTTVWSCSLPKEEHDSVAPFKANQPDFIFQVQYDNNTQKLWKVQGDDEKILTDPGFSPNPDPPSLAEMRFLGNTTDHIEADDKAGEPTPFYISLLTTASDSVGPNVLTRRQGLNTGIGDAPDNSTDSGDADNDDSDSDDGGSGDDNNIAFPAPHLNSDGTGAAAAVFARPVQQPVRLFDRGLPTEHYGFYSYFDKTIYVRNGTSADPEDEDGGVAPADARLLATFVQTRFLVQIWTRMENTTRLLGVNGTVSSSSSSSSSSTSSNDEEDGQKQQQPGTMPYPVTLTVDMHGGDKTKKTSFFYRVAAGGAVNTTASPTLIIADRGAGGTLINPIDDVDPALGGIEGGTGGCKCEWVNFKGV
ncbi:hypothetical protein F4778DRAFT_111296 [Xylariomycetidae sp. FL2044]|nr:hypothetical protein F4778DRAFT_111296 [Xylariomycetidae sp. FL2044]